MADLKQNEPKVTYGLSNVRVAEITIGSNGEITYGKPEPIPGAVDLTLDPAGDETKFFADNVVYYLAGSNQGYTGTLTLANIPSWYETKYLGHKEASNGSIVELADAPKKQHALLFQFEGDAAATKHILFNVQPGRPSFGGHTKEESVDPNTVELPISAVPVVCDFGTIVKAKSFKGSSNYDDFYKNAPTLPTESVA